MSSFDYEVADNNQTELFRSAKSVVVIPRRRASVITKEPRDQCSNTIDASNFTKPAAV
jgi:hypothetical protein